MLTLRIEAYFAKFAQTFRKTLPLDYKKGDRHTHRNPHALPLKVKHDLMNVYCFFYSRLKEVEIGKEYVNIREIV